MQKARRGMTETEAHGKSAMRRRRRRDRVKGED